MGRARVREIAKKYLGEGNPTGWFEAVYSEAARNSQAVPWANMVANPNLVGWLDGKNIDGKRRRALVVGCGLGDDAEGLAARGFEVTAFDISSEAIRWAKQRFPNSPVHYEIADLFASPAKWNSSFDFIFEAYTLQS